MDSTQVVEPQSGEPAERSRKRRAPGGRKVTVPLVIAALGFVGWTSLRLAGLEVNRYSAALIALMPYAVLAGALLFVVALLLRRWLTTLIVGVTAAILAATVAPRAIPDPPTPLQGQPLTVMSINVYYGEADARRIVDLVRGGQVDVLALQELNPRMVDKLRRAGLFEQLPHRVLRSEPGADGTGIVSRFPLRGLSLMPETTMRQPSARIDIPGPRDVEFVAVHPVVPIGAGTTVKWKHEIRALPNPTPGQEGAARVLAGDFNATLDHTPLRKLLGRGYSDAAEITGDGLVPTWPELGRPWAPPVTLDHVLVSGDTVVRGYRTFRVDGTDHRAVLANLAVPS